MDFFAGRSSGSMGVSKNNATPKWMVKIMVPNPMNKWDDLGGFPIIFGRPPIFTIHFFMDFVMVNAGEYDASHGSHSHGNQHGTPPKGTPPSPRNSRPGP